MLAWKDYISEGASLSICGVAVLNPKQMIVRRVHEGWRLHTEGVVDRELWNWMCCCCYCGSLTETKRGINTPLRKWHECYIRVTSIAMFVERGEGEEKEGMRRQHFYQHLWYFRHHLSFLLAPTCPRDHGHKRSPARLVGRSRPCLIEVVWVLVSDRVC